MPITIDEMYLAVVSLTGRVVNSKERDDIQTMAQEAYAQEDMKALNALFTRLRAMRPMTGAVRQVKRRGPITLPANVEASGMPDPKVYNYYTNYNSPLNMGPPPQFSGAYPLYANFGAYDQNRSVP